MNAFLTKIDWDKFRFGSWIVLAGGRALRRFSANRIWASGLANFRFLKYSKGTKGPTSVTRGAVVDDFHETLKSRRPVLLMLWIELGELAVSLPLASQLNVFLTAIYLLWQQPSG